MLLLAKSSLGPYPHIDWKLLSTDPTDVVPEMCGILAFVYYVFVTWINKIALGINTDTWSIVGEQLTLIEAVTVVTG